MTSEETQKNDEITPNKKQEKAIKSSSDRLRLVAGPGTGKTETLTRRIAYLIEDRDVPPESIIAFTFTEKAASELLMRVERQVGSLETRPWVGTIHAFCLELLEEYREEIFDGDHTVLAEEGQLVFLYTNYNELGLDDVHFPLSVVAGHFSKAMDLGVEPTTYRRYAENFLAKTRSLPEHRPDRRTKLENAEDRVAVATAYEQYHELMAERDTLDYATMIERALELVSSHDQVKSDLETQYTHLLVDEYQDTNRTQEALIKEIVKCETELCVVGDDDQSIYRFRGATVDNLLEFDSRFDASETIKIERNYRSDKRIIAASQELIKNNDRRLKKEIEPDSDDSGEIGIICKSTPTAEVAAVVDQIETIIADGTEPQEIAILFRSVTRDAAPYSDALRNRGIPVEVTGVADIFDDNFVTEILTVIDYLLNDVSAADLSDLDLLALCDETTDTFATGEDPSCKHAGCHTTVAAVRELDSEYSADSFVDPKQIFYELLECFPSVRNLISEYTERDASEQLRYLAGLSDVLDQISTISEHTTLNYLRKILSLVEDQGVEPDLPDREGDVNIMTVHQAKGLEFGTVVIPRLTEGTFPSTGRPDPLQIPSQLRDEPEYKESDGPIADERRLFYVALTRAESKVILATNKQNDPSRFLQELPTPELTELDPKPALAEEDVRYTLARRDNLESTSFTQISYFAQCPLRFGLLFDYGFERTDQPQFFYGISVHRALERFFNEIAGETTPAKDHLLEALDIEWISRGYQGETQEGRFRQNAEEILTAYVDAHTENFSQIEYVEHPFSMLHDGIQVEGEMDRVDRLPSGELQITDFKVGEASDPGPWERFQLQLYALACEQTLDETVSGCQFHFLANNTQVPVEFDDEVRQETIDRLSTVLEKMRRRDYPANTGDHCSRCDFNGICPAVNNQ
ncbi:ATP-dependent helicase [Halostagnicola bangensis]